MKAIIVGCGTQGSILARILEDEGVEVTVIDNSSKALSQLEKFKGKKVLGDGMKEQTLVRAGVEGADAFAAVTNSDNINLVAAQIARGIFQVPRVVCRVYDPGRAGVYSELGLDTMNFSVTGAHLLKNYLMNPRISRRETIGDGSAVAIEFELPEYFDGRTVEVLNIDGVFRCSSIIRDLKVIIADPDVELQAGDRVFGVALTDRVHEIFEPIEEAEEDTPESEDSDMLTDSEEELDTQTTGELDLETMEMPVSIEKKTEEK
jgi:trk system potassium uptake protein